MGASCGLHVGGHPDLELQGIGDLFGGPEEMRNAVWRTKSMHGQLRVQRQRLHQGVRAVLRRATAPSTKTARSARPAWTSTALLSGSPAPAGPRPRSGRDDSRELCSTRYPSERFLTKKPNPGRNAFFNVRPVVWPS